MKSVPQLPVRCGCSVSVPVAPRRAQEVWDHTGAVAGALGLGSGRRSGRGWERGPMGVSEVTLREWRKAVCKCRLPCLGPDASRKSPLGGGGRGRARLASGSPGEGGGGGCTWGGVLCRCGLGRGDGAAVFPGCRSRIGRGGGRKRTRRDSVLGVTQVMPFEEREL